MPKWVAYCRRCNRASTYQKIDLATPGLTSLIGCALPTVKKPELPAEGQKWECPYCKRESSIKVSDLTFSYA